MKPRGKVMSQNCHGTSPNGSLDIDPMRYLTAGGRGVAGGPSRRQSRANPQRHPNRNPVAALAISRRRAHTGTVRNRVAVVPDLILVSHGRPSSLGPTLGWRPQRSWRCPSRTLSRPMMQGTKSPPWMPSSSVWRPRLPCPDLNSQLSALNPPSTSPSPRLPGIVGAVCRSP